MEEMGFKDTYNKVKIMLNVINSFDSTGNDLIFYTSRNLKYNNVSKFVVDTIRLLNLLNSLYTEEDNNRCDINTIFDSVCNILNKVSSNKNIEKDINTFFFNTYNYDLKCGNFTLIKKLINGGLNINYREGLSSDSHSFLSDTKGKGLNLYYKVVKFILESNRVSDSVYEFLEWLIDNNIEKMYRLNVCVEVFRNFKKDDRLLNTVIKADPLNNSGSLLASLIEANINELLIIPYLHLFNEDNYNIYLLKALNDNYSKAFSGMLRDKVLGNKIGGRNVK